MTDAFPYTTLRGWARNVITDNGICHNFGDFLVDFMTSDGMTFA